MLEACTEIYQIVENRNTCHINCFFTNAFTNKCDLMCCVDEVIPLIWEVLLVCDGRSMSYC